LAHRGGIADCVRLVVLGGAVLGAACSPALDWREVRPADTSVTVLLPCKPQVSARSVNLAGRAVRLSMMACKADAWTWALVSTDVADPALVEPVLNALRDSTVANVQGRVLSSAPVAVRGVVPRAAHAGVLVRGRKPDGAAANAQFVVFSHGTQVFQAIVMGETAPGQAAESFFYSLRVAP
jgi:hypothetical protein